MKRTTAKSCLAILVAAVVVHPVLADDDPSESDKSTARATFDALDQNGDGTIVATEVKPAQDKAFQQLLRVSDANKDGSLSLAEFLGGLQAKDRQPEPSSSTQRSGGRGSSRRNFAQQLFLRYDRNKDGRLDKDELPADAGPTVRALFDRLGKDSITTEDLSRSSSRSSGRPDLTQTLKRWDANGDGKLSPDEVPDRARPLIAGMLRRAGKSPTDTLTLEDVKQREQPGQGSRSRSTPTDTASRNRGASQRTASDRPDRRRSPAASSSGLPGLLLTLDTNGDGQWDRDEFSRLVKLFDKLDSDHDGRVNSRELFGDRSTPNNGDRPASRQSRSRNSRESDAPRPNTPTRQRSTASTPFLIRRLDRDQDGKISKDEAQGRLRENFEKLDTDGNGFLNPSEIQKAASDRNRPQRSTRSEPGRETDRPRRERRPPQ